MHRARAIALASLAILLAIPSAAATTVALPPWEPGDEWTFAVSLVQDGELVQSGEKHVVVTARGPASYQGASRETVTITTWLNMSGDPSQSWTDLRDAATGAFLATASGGSTLDAKEPCADIAYPLSMDKRWTSTCDLGGGPSETSYQVVGGETLALPAGTFDALTVDAIGHDALRMWFSDEACGQVAEFSQTNALATYVNLTAFRCAALARAPTPATPSTTATPPPSASTTGPGAPTPGPTATPTSGESAVYDYTCPQERARWPNFTQAECDAFDADGDLFETAQERRIDANPYAADTDGDGAIDSKDKFTRDPSKQSPPAPLALVLVALALLALAARRKAS